MNEINTKIEGRNAVIEALRSDRSVDKVMILDGAHDNALGTIIKEVKKHPETKLEFVSKQRLDSLSETGGKHQGVIAFAAAYDYAELSDILANAERKGEQPFIFILDGIEDPHNLGAIIRSAEAGGAHGIIIPERRSAALTGIVSKTSAGALEYLPVARVTNLTATIRDLQKEGVWVYAADMDGTPYDQTDFSGPVALVIGAEGAGVSRLVGETCDGIVSIPMTGKINSLNASVAAGILIFRVALTRSKN